MDTTARFETQTSPITGTLPGGWSQWPGRISSSKRDAGAVVGLPLAGGNSQFGHGEIRQLSKVWVALLPFQSYCL